MISAIVHVTRFDDAAPIGISYYVAVRVNGFDIALHIFCHAGIRGSVNSLKDRYRNIGGEPQCVAIDEYIATAFSYNKNIFMLHPVRSPLPIDHIYWSQNLSLFLVRMYMFLRKIILNFSAEDF